MKTRIARPLVDELMKKVAEVRLMIDEIIELQSMRVLYQNAQNNLRALTAQREQHAAYCLHSRLLDKNVLSSRYNANELHRRIEETSNNIESIAQNLHTLEQEKRLRIRPLTDLVDVVVNSQGNINPKIINKLLDSAKTLNPEGTLLDKLKMIGDIIKKIFTLRFYEIKDVCECLRRRKHFQSELSGLFKQQLVPAKGESEENTESKPCLTM